jgi:hypothetical protein
VAERVVDEGERVLPGQGREPQRDLGEVDGDGVAVDAVEAALGDEAAGEDDLVLVGRDRGHLAVRVPRFNQRVAEVAARLDQEGARAHRRVAHLEVEQSGEGE